MDSASPLIENNMSMDEQTVHGLASVALRRESERHRRVNWRRLHFDNDASVEPKLGEYIAGKPAPNNPFTDVSDFQSDTPRRIAQQVISRLSENPPVFKAVTRRASSNSDAINASLIANAWLREVEQRTNVKVQQAMGYGQVRDCYAIIHTYRLDHLRPPVEREVYTVEEFQAMVSAGQDTSGLMTSLDGEGYEETEETRKSRRDEQYAGAGCPWTIEFPDPMYFARIPSKYGPGDDVVVLAYEVDAFLYDLNIDKEIAGVPSDLGSLVAAPGIEQSRSDSDATYNTPSSTDYRDRRKVWQIWTREEFYELADYQIVTGRGRSRRLRSGGFKLVKAFKHDYGQVPFFVVWANRNYSPDPATEAEPYLEGIYRLKPDFDRSMKLASALVELTAMPQFYRQDDPNAPSHLLEDGDIPDEDSESMHGGKIPAGQRVVPLNTQVTHGIPQVLQLKMAMMKEAEPGTGSVEIGASTAPWTARIWQTQANIGPRLLLENQAAALRWCAEIWRDWHVRHPEEPFLAYTHPSQSKKEIVKLDPKKLASLEFECSISPLSSAERLTIAEHLSGFVERGFRKKVDLLSEGFGEKDPYTYDNELLVDNAILPFKQKLVETMMQARAAKMFTTGSDGKVRDGSGTEVDYREVLARNGYVVPSLEEEKAQKAMVAQQQGGGGGAPLGGSITRSDPGGATLAASMPQMSGLAAPGTQQVMGLNG